MMLIFICNKKFLVKYECAVDRIPRWSPSSLAPVLFLNGTMITEDTAQSPEPSQEPQELSPGLIKNPTLAWLNFRTFMDR